ncbi:MAG TPA: class I SAM-dependent methyltransferase [Edaphobacter sp.]
MVESHSFSPSPTFRDPAGSVEIRPDGAYRSIRSPFDDEILAFLDLSIASELVANGRLVGSEVVGRNSDTETLVLRHPRISFQSYPWEWPPALWLAAAELTLSLCSDLVRQGWLLKDATPLNVLFQGMEPVFVDVLSIERATPGLPIWIPYGQFVRTFLLPMLAHSQLGWPLQVALTRRDGYEPEEIFASLSWPARLRQPALSAVTLPTLLAGKTKGNGSLATRTVKDPDLAKQIIQKTLSNLLVRMRQVTPAHRASAGTGDAESATDRSDEDQHHLDAFVAAALAASNPSRVLDVGCCNTGVYSLLAADTGAEVVSIDADLQAADRLCAKLKGSGKNILPLYVDLAYPSPSVGWENSEAPSFLNRCYGHFDTVMMLAVIHRLLLHSQIPMDRIAALCSKLTTENLILEWVPPSSVEFRELLRGRDDIYSHITEAFFREAFARHFTVVSELTLANDRILLHFKRR